MSFEKMKSQKKLIWLF